MRLVLVAKAQPKKACCQGGGNKDPPRCEAFVPNRDALLSDPED